MTVLSINLREEKIFISEECLKFHLFLEKIWNNPSITLIRALICSDCADYQRGILKSPFLLGQKKDPLGRAHLVGSLAFLQL